jgi:hypothetical protein
MNSNLKVSFGSHFRQNPLRREVHKMCSNIELDVITEASNDFLDNYKEFMVGIFGI